MQSTHTRTQKHSWTIISHHYWMWMITLMMMKWESRERRMIDCNNEKNLNLTDVFPLFLKHEIKNCNFVTLNLNNFINFPQNQLFYQKLTASHKFESFFSFHEASLNSCLLETPFHSPSSALSSPFYLFLPFTHF